MLTGVGNVFLFSSKDDVEELPLCVGGYGGLGGKTFLTLDFHSLSSDAASPTQAMNPFRTGQLVMFEVRYDRTWHFFELLFFLLIGVFGGLYGAFVMKWNLRAQAFRKKYLGKYAIPEATLLAAGTALLCYPNMFLRLDMTENMEILFRECEGDYDYQGLCE